MGTKNNPSKFDCYANAFPDEPMFVLLARDRHAAGLVLLWAMLRERECEDPAVLAEARECADAMASFIKQTKGRPPADVLAELLNKPHLKDFARALQLEAHHQVGRWGSEHDEGKTPGDWFWLIGYLAQKAMMSQLAGDKDKALHHCITTASAMANWHAAIAGTDPRMRPGIAPPGQMRDADVALLERAIEVLAERSPTTGAGVKEAFARIIGRGA